MGDQEKPVAKRRRPSKSFRQVTLGGVVVMLLCFAALFGLEFWMYHLGILATEDWRRLLLFRGGSVIFALLLVFICSFEAWQGGFYEGYDRGKAERPDDEAMPSEEVARRESKSSGN